MSNHFILTTSGVSITVRFGGQAVVAGQFGAWTPIGAELVNGFYEIVWKNPNTLQYVIWWVDTNGNYVSQSAPLTGSSAEIRAREAGFNQDLNGGGIETPTTIENTGTTRLSTIANTYLLSPVNSFLGVQLKYNGSLVTAGQFGAWTPLATEFSNGLYYVAWKNGAANQYLSWYVDANGNYLAQGAVIGGTTWYLESLESIVQYDLNGDGLVGPTTSTIEATGHTSLTKVADSYFFNYGTAGAIQLKYGGSYVAPGQFGAWTPLATEFSNGLYYVAWKNGAANQYLSWYVDANGNYLAQGAVIGGTTWYLESLESIVQYDLNGDGLVGPTVVGIEASGMSSLSQVADSYFINYGGSNAVQVLYGGSYAGANQFPNWSAVGAEQTIGSYMVAWRNSATGNYIVWNTDAGGNYLWQTPDISVGSSMFFAVEASMRQNFTGGIMPGVTPIEGAGTTALYNASGFLMMDRGPLTGPLLAYANNTYVTASQFGTVLGAEWIGNGYQVAWKTGTDAYNFWTTDASGRFVSQTGNLSGGSAQMQAFEPTFGQDLNGDGVIGINPTPFNIQIVFTGLSQYQTYFTQAAQRWQNIIRNDLSAVNSSTYGLIDDLRIDASVQFIDGVNGILARAGWDLRRSSSDGGLPYHGIMQFDSADVTSMVNSGIFLDVVTHEMGHVLGIGTLWDTFGLRSGASYLGVNANNAYHQLGGVGFVPLETTGGSGTAFSHWSEAVFDRELMTGFAETSPPMPLSIVTIGGLQDLGYQVDYSRADPYSLPGHLTAGLDSNVVDDRAAASGAGILSESSLTPAATGGSDTLAFNGSVVDDWGKASSEGILQDSADTVTEDQGINGGAGLVMNNTSLLTNYMASSFATSPGEGAGTVAPAQSNTVDVLARPMA